MEAYNPLSKKGFVCKVEKIVELNPDDFKFFSGNLWQTADFIDNNFDEGSFQPNGISRCIYVKRDDAEYGILICKDGKDGTLYTSYLPKLTEFSNTLNIENQSDTNIEPQITV